MKNPLVLAGRITFYVVILTLVGCASAPVLETYSHKEIKHPAPLTENTATKGQLVYLHYDYDSLIIYRLQEPLDVRLMLGKVVVSNQEPLYRGIFKQKEVLCSNSKTYSDLIAGPLAISCFYDIGRTGKVDTVTAAPNAVWFEKSIDQSIPYEGAEELVRSQSNPVKKELLFNGYLDGKLLLTYREYQNDLKNAAVNQPLIIPIESFPAQKEIKGLSIELLSATDAQISYKILSGSKK